MLHTDTEHEIVVVVVANQRKVLFVNIGIGLWFQGSNRSSCVDTTRKVNLRLCYGEGFYRTNLLVDRLNEVQDRIPIIVSDRLLDMDNCYAGSHIELMGEFRSYTSGEEEGREPKKRKLSVFAHEIRLLEGEDAKNTEDEDTIYIEGYLTRPPVYRVTPLGREITELILMVPRNYGKSDYIPCICWGRNARFGARFRPGEKVTVTGRIQSRDYFKQIDDKTKKRMTTCEVSVTRIRREED